MVAEAKRIEDGKIIFYDDIDSAVAALECVDLVFTSGALQYTPSPLQFLAKLLSVGSEYIFITRTALTLGVEKVIIQNTKLSEHGPGAGDLPHAIQDRNVSLPVCFVNKIEFEEMIGQRYNIESIFYEDKSAYYAGGKPIDMYGYFCKRKS
jgi:putative methyltransferase (TIGR04325 family)